MEPKGARRIVQICPARKNAESVYLHALDNRGDVWAAHQAPGGPQWLKFPPLPIGGGYSGDGAEVLCDEYTEALDEIVAQHEYLVAAMGGDQ